MGMMVALLDRPMSAGSGSEVEGELGWLADHFDIPDDAVIRLGVDDLRHVGRLSSRR